MRLRTGQASRHDLAVFLNEVAQGIDILVVDLFDVFNRETAELLALEERILLVGTAGLPLPFAPKAIFQLLILNSVMWTVSFELLSERCAMKPFMSSVLPSSTLSSLAAVSANREVKLYFPHRSGFELLPGVVTPSFENRNSCRRVTQFFFFDQNRADDDAVVRIHSRDDLKICLD